MTTHAALALQHAVYKTSRRNIERKAWDGHRTRPGERQAVQQDFQSVDGLAETTDSAKRLFRMRLLNLTANGVKHERRRGQGIEVGALDGAAQVEGQAFHGLLGIGAAQLFNALPASAARAFGALQEKQDA